MQQIILSGNYPTTYTDQNPSPYSNPRISKEEKLGKYQALYGGLFKEVFEQQTTGAYRHFVFDTKTKKLKSINTTAQENELIDPVAFAYDFGARMYDARLGRWMSTDPLQTKYPSLSPYNGLGNNPILFIDDDGREIFAYTDIENDLVLKTTINLFGNENGFSFDGNKLVHTGDIPIKQTNEQKLLYKYFTETILVSKTPVYIHPNQDISVKYSSFGNMSLVETPNGGVLTTQNPERTIELNGNETSESSGVKLLNPIVTIPAEINISLSKKLLATGKIALSEMEFPKEHAIAHEFGHAIMNIIMNEFGGKFNDIDFNKLSDAQRSDWVIRYTNTLLKGAHKNLENVKGNTNERSQSSLRHQM